jgi:hypothetical protein
MAKRDIRSTAITAELAAGRLDRHDKNITRALISGSKRGALANGGRQAAERDELVKSIDQHGVVPAISRGDAAEAININNSRVQQVEHRRGANAIVKALRPSAVLLLGSVAVDIAQRLVAAGRKIRSRMIQRLGDQKRRWRRVRNRRSQRWAYCNRIVAQNLGCSVRPLNRSTIIWRTGRLPFGREE